MTPAHRIIRTLGYAETCRLVRRMDKLSRVARYESTRTKARRVAMALRVELDYHETRRR